MTTRSTLLLLLASLAGCASTHGPSDEPHPTTESLSALESCLAEGGALHLAAEVDNDDVTDHGELFTLAVGDDGRIAVAAADGTIKLWTMEGFITTVSAPLLTYGPELSQAPVHDLIFAGDAIIAGDASGLVSEWDRELNYTLVGGTDPNQGIVAVAVDPTHAWLAHADVQAGGHVMLRALDGSAIVGPLTTELASVHDLAYLDDGALLLAGGAGAPLLELRDASDVSAVRASWRGEGGELVEVAVASDRIAAVSGDRVTLLDASLSELWSADASAHAPVSVALTSNARFVVTAGADGSLRVWDAEDGTEQGSADVTDPVVVRAAPAGTAIISGSRDGAVRAFDCSAP